MLCGHVAARAGRSDIYDGHTVHTLLADYQARTNGGNGWLAHPHVPSGRRRPPREDLLADARPLRGGRRFEQPVRARDRHRGGEEWQLIGTVTGVASGSAASVQWPGLSALTEYEWYATVSDDESSTRGRRGASRRRSLAPTRRWCTRTAARSSTWTMWSSLQWTATDDVAVTAVDILLSRTGAGGTYEPIASGLPNTGSFDWTVTAPGRSRRSSRSSPTTRTTNTAEDCERLDVRRLRGRRRAGRRDRQLRARDEVRQPRERRGRTRARGAARCPRSRRRVRRARPRGRGDRRRHARGRLARARVERRGPRRRAASGIYFVRVETPEGRLSRKVALVR